ncbi:MAG: hypothetical protein Q8K78_13900 [Planctomycetaceae bacterium]|nr:hypothetical protein [Planctomycetaceae bacterium]
MQPVSNDTFGPLVAYLIPGATALVGFEPYSPVLQSWLASAPPEAPTIGGFLYLTVASLAAGMTMNAVRWAVLDTIHAWTGLRMPAFDFARLAGREQALALLIDIHYKHYQLHGSMLIATAVAYVGSRSAERITGGLGLFDLLVAILEVVFFLMSRDTLERYQRRVAQLLGTTSLPASSLDAD